MHMSTVSRFPDGQAYLERIQRAAEPNFRNVTVLFTELGATLRAVAVARQLGRALDAEVTVIALKASLASPRGGEVSTPIDADTNTLHLRLRASGNDVRFRVVVSSGASEALRLLLPPGSLVVIGGRRRWWPTAVSRLRRLLEAHGHYVLLIPEVAHVG